MIISVTFFAFLICTAIIYWFIPRQHLRNLFLSLASLGFITLYDKWGAVIVLILTSFVYVCAWMVETRDHRVLFHRIGVVGLLLALVLFKYLGLLAGTLDHLVRFVSNLPSFSLDHLLPPLGISYITFKYISYITDVHWRLTGRGRFVDVLCYGSLFTIFVAGPIERFERFKPQVESVRIDFDWDHVETAFRRIVFGLFKKLVLADWIGYFVNPVWRSPDDYSFWIRVLALTGYSFQIYMDFAGYSDIAIGASRLFGLTIMENFDWPYLQQNIGSFWRHWHISLSDWIRDYVFFPLSRLSHAKSWTMIGVPIIAMSLCGLWHGAAWHFVAWGAWHGFGVACLQLWNLYRRKRGIVASSGRVAVVLGVVSTFVFVTIGWIIFRA